MKPNAPCPAGKRAVPFLAALIASLSLASAAEKTLIDYFKPMPIGGKLSSEAWGAPGVLPRDPQNGLEDPTMEKWCYWDGAVIKGPDEKFHLFASRWDQAKGHDGWWGSNAVHAVSDRIDGPYQDKGLCWPDNQGGKGHNVTALKLPDGRYAVVTSETRPGDVFVSNSLDGPWEHLGKIQVAENEFSKFGKMSNVCVLLRPDGDFMIVARSGAIWISKTGILGPYTVQGPSVYPTVKGLPLKDLEDPILWHSGGFYHIVVNGWSTRKAWHITSKNGIDGWTLRGLAYDPTRDFLRYTDGTVNHWDKIERPAVVMENGHVTHFLLSVLDVPKDQEKGNDRHGSKIIVVPFDGAALDRDLQPAATPPIRVLIVDGFSNHDWKQTTALIRGIIEPSGGFTVTVSTAPPTKDSPGWDTWRPAFKDYDVVIQNCNDIKGGPPWPQEVRDSFEKFVGDGGGVLVWHSGNNAFANWPAYNQMIGLGWRGKDFGEAIAVSDSGELIHIPAGEGGGTSHGDRVDTVVTRRGEHPIHAGLPKRWKTPDIEIYHHARGPAKNLEVLSYGFDPRTKMNWPLEWTVTYGKGRIYTSTFGHVWPGDTQPERMRCAGVQAITLRALQWLAGRPVTSPVPEDFPSETKMSIRGEIPLPASKP